ncbi:hypothetical protein [Anaerolactibacter massiliensis]|uniref:hypothetical protein n=1 Tax=Anaerolactibacter massiliensis TaxID=2044573 RepID=UPI000CF91920|nr:hypothetical protein [Anaerolactibacter massiliensis]
MPIQTQTVNLNLTPSGVPPIVHLKQYDRESRTITCTVYDGSALFSAPSGASATIRGTKPDNTGFEYAATISGSTVTFTVQDQMTVLSGDIPSEIRIIFGSQVIGTISIVLRVEPSALKSDVTVSKTDLPLIAEAAKNIVDAKKYMESASASASSAASSASSASASEKSASDSAASASASATTAAGYAGAAQYSLGVDPDTGLFGVFKNS